MYPKNNHNENIMCNEKANNERNKTMETISVNSSLKTIPVKLNLSQRLVFILLTKMQGVSLTLIDPSGRYLFGDKHAELAMNIRIHDFKAYKKLLWGGSIGAAEAYVEGLWSSDNLVAVIQGFSRNLEPLAKYEKKYGWIASPFNKLRHRLNDGTKANSRTNIAAHYDLSNSMYELFLGPYMQYSSAIFPHPDASLAEAQAHKLHTICQSLKLSADDHLLEVGTGWGGLACFAAQYYGCKVTTTTISQAQFDHAQKRIVDAGLNDQVTLLCQDYRDLTGTFSKIVSVEMIEAVGKRYLKEYFRKLDRLLEQGGRMLIQAITIGDQRYDLYSSEVDFIQKYIFPGGHLPCMSDICQHMKKETSLRLDHFQDYAMDYAKTLGIWRERFLQATPDILDLGFNQDFIRLWDYYFSYCEGGFREAVIGLGHIHFVKDQQHV